MGSAHGKYIERATHAISPTKNVTQELQAIEKRDPNLMNELLKEKNLQNSKTKSDKMTVNS